jgi:hypothetical protein
MALPDEPPRINYAPAPPSFPKARFIAASLLCLFLVLALYVGIISAGYVRWNIYQWDRMRDRMWEPFHISLVGLSLNLLGAGMGIVASARNERPSVLAALGVYFNLLLAGIGLLDSASGL